LSENIKEIALLFFELLRETSKVGGGGRSLSNNLRKVKIVIKTS